MTQNERLAKYLPPKSGEILLEIIMRRYENRSIIMTSNRPIEEWGKLLSDVTAASAILGRLLHHAEVVAISGRSYRIQPVAKPSQGQPLGALQLSLANNRNPVALRSSEFKLKSGINRSPLR